MGRQEFEASVWKSGRLSIWGSVMVAVGGAGVLLALIAPSPAFLGPVASLVALIGAFLVGRGFQMETQQFEEIMACAAAPSLSEPQVTVVEMIREPCDGADGVEFFVLVNNVNREDEEFSCLGKFPEIEDATKFVEDSLAWNGGMLDVFTVVEGREIELKIEKVATVSKEKDDVHS